MCIRDSPSAAQDAATKNYVDTNIVGNLVFQGGYNAATNTPDLDSSPSASIKKGWAYVVTAAVVSLLRLLKWVISYLFKAMLQLHYQTG